jgi:hypothetical protein
MLKQINYYIILVSLLIFIPIMAYPKCLLNTEYCVIIDKQGNITNFFDLIEPIENIINNTTNEISLGNLCKDIEPKECLKKKIFSSGDELHFLIVNNEKKDKYQLEFTTSKIEYQSIPVFTTPFQRQAGTKGFLQVPILTKIDSITLNESGTLYTIQIKKKNGENITGNIVKSDKTTITIKVELADAGTIFEQKFPTYMKYYLGLQVGGFFPFSKDKLSIKKYPYPYDVNYYILKSKHIYLPKGVVLATIYPFGFEPERWNCSELKKKGEASKWWYRSFQLVIGTELSKNIFKNVDFGIGYCFSYVAINFIFDWSSTVEKVKLKNYKNVALFPTVSIDNCTTNINKWTFGFSLSMPIDFWVAKIISGKL